MISPAPAKEALETARTLHRGGHLRRALDAYEAVLKIDPKNPDALFGSGMVLTALGARTAAIGQVEKARASAPERVDIAFAFAGLLSEIGRLTASEDAYRHAVAITGDARGLLAYAQGMRQLGRLDAAEHALRSAIALDPAPPLWLALSDVLIDRYRIEEAVAACREAVALAPEAATAHLRLGTRLLEAGQADAARLAFRDAIRYEPANTAAHYSLARITKHLPGDDRIGELSALAIAQQLPARQRADAHFALFKAHEDIGKHDLAFDHLATANTLVRQQLTYSTEADQRYFARIEQVFDGIPPAGPIQPDAPGGGHIFVVGLPRSGTTLVEQILASHPMVHGAGEIQNLRREMLRGLERIGRDDGFPDGVSHLDADNWREVGLGYETSLEPSGRPVTVNKTPGNFQMVPAIWSALPGARIVHCRRNPLDTCFSIYRHNFVGWGFHYAYDQEEAASLYAVYDRFMAHWSSARPDGMFELSYERLVSDPEGTTRALLDYCALPWDSRCLDFASTSRIVRTASIEQVRQPIHSQAIGSWRRYAARLAPMRARLAEAGIQAET
ncbi:MAG: sulfotransferase [Thalassobaculaceae bacterium]|nr:sulfotransferase [Thalassobaculaceae bacterium]